MIRRPPRSTQSRSSAASDVYKRQEVAQELRALETEFALLPPLDVIEQQIADSFEQRSVSYTHLRAHETVLELVCRLLLEKKNTQTTLVAKI